MATPPQKPAPVPDVLLGIYTDMNKPAGTPATPEPRPPKRLPPWLEKIAMGLFCSTAVTVIMNFTNLKKIAVSACSLVVAIFGTTPEAESLKEKARAAVAKIEKAEAEGKKPGLLAKFAKPGEIIAQKSKEAIDGGVEKGKEVVVKAAEPVKAGIEKATDKVEEGVTALKNIGPGGGQGMDAPPAGARQPMPRTATGTIVNAFSRGNAAHANGMTNDGASYADFWAESGPNGKCPNPACKFPMKVPPKSRASYRCPNLRCGWTTSAVHIRAMGAPEPPRTTPLAYSAWREKKLKEIDEQAKKPQAAPKAAPLVGPPKPESPAVTQASGEAAR